MISSTEALKQLQTKANPKKAAEMKKSEEKKKKKVRKVVR